MQKLTQKNLNEIINKLDSYLNDLIENDEFSGAVLVGSKGESLYKKAFGLAHRGFKIPNQVNTKFNLGSMNKMFTGLAIAQLVEKECLNYDNLVKDILPNYPNQDIAANVNIHQLLTHTSGMGSHFNQKYMQTSKDRFRTVDDFIPLFVDDELSFRPGSKFQYSNAGYLLLGKIIEEVSGKSYYDQIREGIYQPAGMNNTECYELDYDTPNLAQGYTRIFPEKNGELRNNIFLHVVKGGPAGGGYSTVEDLFKFSKALQNGSLLKLDNLETTWSGKVDRKGPHDRYAYGFTENLAFGTRIMGHGGGFPGINSRLDMYPDQEICVAVMSNYDPRTAEKVTTRLRYMLTETPLPEFIEFSSEDLISLTGVYILDQSDLKINILIRDSKLWIQSPEMGSICIMPISNKIFIDQETFENQYIFDIGDLGKVEKLSTAAFGPQMIFKKI
ncbi:MAG: beta-lactamase family protein [Anaerolineaceae bacterium]|nr:beta-lactamase family protein [Anaerolineaceae bacterium]